MRERRFLQCCFAFALFFVPSTPAAAAGTAAGTVISETGTASYTNAAATVFNVTGNTVTTTVQNSPFLTITDPGVQNVTPGDVVLDTFTLANAGNNAGKFALTADATFGGTATGTTLKGYVINGASSGTCSTTTLCTTFSALNTQIATLASTAIGGTLTVGVEYQASSSATTGQTIQPSITANIAYVAGTGTSAQTSSNVTNAAYNDTLMTDARLDVQTTVVNPTGPSGGAANITWTVRANNGGANPALDLLSAKAALGAAAAGIALFVPMPSFPAGTTYLQLTTTPTLTLTGGSAGAAAALYYNATACSAAPTAGWSTTYAAASKCLAVYISGGTGGGAELPAVAGTFAGSVSSGQAQVALSFTTTPPTGAGSGNANAVTLLASSAIGGNAWASGVSPILGQGATMGTPDSATASLLNGIQANATASSGTTPPGGASNSSGSHAFVVTASMTITDPSVQNVTPSMIAVDTFTLANTTASGTGTFQVTAGATFTGTATAPSILGYVLGGLASGTCSLATPCTLAVLNGSGELLAGGVAAAGGTQTVAVEYQVGSSATAAQTILPSISATIAVSGDTTSTAAANAAYTDTVVTDARLDVQATVVAPTGSSGAASYISWTVRANNGGANPALDLLSAKAALGAAAAGIALFVPMPSFPAGTTYLQLTTTPTLTLTGGSAGAAAALYYNATACSAAPTAGWSTTYAAASECMAVYISGGSSGGAELPAVAGTSAGSVTSGQAQVTLSFITTPPSSSTANAVTLIASGAIGGTVWATGSTPILGQGVTMGTADAATAALIAGIQNNTTASSGTIAPGGASNQSGSQAYLSTPPPPVPTGIQVSSNGSATLYTVTWNAAPGATSYNLYRGASRGTEGGTAYQTAIGTTSYANTVIAASTYCYQVTAVNASGESARSAEVCETGVVFQAYRIAAGSAAAIGIFAADTIGVGGAANSVGNTVSTSGELCSPAPAGVFDTNRSGYPITYTFTGLSASMPYLVRLHFAETYAPFVAGSRTFNVAINGTTVLTNFDIYASSGGTNIAVVREFLQKSQFDGSMAIVFTRVTDQPQINGLEVIQVANLNAVGMLLTLSATGAQTPGTNLTYSGNFSSNATASSVAVAAPVSANTYFQIGSTSASSLASGLTLSSTTYSNNSGTSYVYAPVSAAGGAPAGYDGLVTNVKWTFTGTVCPSGSSAGIVSFSARIR